MTSAQLAGEKYAREWLIAKPTMITNYQEKSSTLAQLAINSKQKLLDNFAAAVNRGDWEAGLRPYIGNTLMGDAYEQSVSAKQGFTDFQVGKVVSSIELKQYLETQLEATIAVFKAAASGSVTVPAGLTDIAIRQMLMSGINHAERNLALNSSPQEIYTAVSSYMNSYYGWPEKA